MEQYITDLYKRERPIRISTCCSEELLQALVQRVLNYQCEYGLRDRTLFLALHILHEYLYLSTEARPPNLECALDAALVIASKWEEVDCVKAVDMHSPLVDVLVMEWNIFKVIDCRTYAATTYDFMAYFLTVHKKIELLPALVVPALMYPLSSAEALLPSQVAAIIVAIAMGSG